MSGVVALVTGGAKGLGRATVGHLVCSGAEAVIAFDYEFVNSFNCSQVIEITGDVCSETDVNIALDVCRQRFRRLDILINCAFFQLSKESKSESISIEEFSNILELNTNSTFNSIRLSVGLMADNPEINGLRALIINTLFIPPSRQSRTSAIYFSEDVVLNSSVGAIRSMTLPLARDLGRQGIRCVAIEVPLNYEKNNLRFDFTQSFVHLIERILGNQMINGNVISLINELNEKSACKL